MKYILPLFDNFGKIVNIFIYVYLTCACIRTGGHFCIELFKRNRLTEVIGIFLSVHKKMETDIAYISLFKMLLCYICNRAAADNIIRHYHVSFRFFAQAFC